MIGIIIAILIVVTILSFIAGLLCVTHIFDFVDDSTRSLVSFVNKGYMLLGLSALSGFILFMIC